MKKNKIKRIVGSIVGVIAILLLALKVILFPRFNLPDVQGNYAIGEVNLQLEDKSRDEIYTQDPDDHRRVMVTVWYPEDKLEGDKEEVRPYPKEVAQAINSVLGIPKFLFAHIKEIPTHIQVEGVPAELEDASPLILYSPGNNSTRFQNMAVVEALVSRGYTVVGVDHPYTSSDFMFLDGTVAKRNLSLDSEGDAVYEEEVKIRTEDLQFVLDSLQSDATILNEKVRQNIDFNRIGALGHSYGGATIAGLMATNASIDAGLSYDGGLWGSIVDQGFQKPFLYLSAEQTLALKDDPESETGSFVNTVVNNLNKAFEKSEADVDFVVLDDYNHYSFTDLPLFSPLFSKGEKPVETTIKMTVDFFDRWLNADGSDQSQEK